jgi:SAM-dependent methyltransferase
MLWRYVEKIDPILKRVYQQISQPPVPNLKGDRDIEYSWVAANMPNGPGEAMDFGCSVGWMGLLAARKGFKVTGVDLEPAIWHYEHPNLKFMQGSILKLSFPPDCFDLIINCSTVEHVGLVGRYSETEPNPDGDIEAMKVLNSILKTNGIMLLTIPVGLDKVFVPLHRIYGENRLPRLFQGWEVLKKEYWIKDTDNRWIMADESAALNKEPLEYCYGLGLFVLKKP